MNDDRQIHLDEGLRALRAERERRPIPSLAELRAYAAGDLTPPRAAAVEARLAVDPELADVVDALTEPDPGLLAIGEGVIRAHAQRRAAGASAAFSPGAARSTGRAGDPRRWLWRSGLGAALAAALVLFLLRPPAPVEPAPVTFGDVRFIQAPPVRTASRVIQVMLDPPPGFAEVTVVEVMGHQASLARPSSPPPSAPVGARFIIKDDGDSRILLIIYTREATGEAQVMAAVGAAVRDEPPFASEPRAARERRLAEALSGLGSAVYVEQSDIYGPPGAP